MDGCDLIQVVCGSPALANVVLRLGKPVSLQVATLAKVERRRRGAAQKTPLDWWRKMMTRITDRLDDRALRSVDAIQLEILGCWTIQCGSTRATPILTSATLHRALMPGGSGLLLTGVFRSCLISCVSDGSRSAEERSPSIGGFSSSSLEFGACALGHLGVWQTAARILGTGPDIGLQDRVSHIDRPETVDLIQLYQQAAVFALSSDEEGLGVVILEAMACGVPVVATRCGGPDGIITDGEDGYLVPVDDADAMAARLAALCADSELNCTLGRHARHTIEARYTEENRWTSFCRRLGAPVEKGGKTLRCAAS